MDLIVFKAGETGEAVDVDVEVERLKAKGAVHGSSKTESIICE